MFKVCLTPLVPVVQTLIMTKISSKGFLPMASLGFGSSVKEKNTSGTGTKRKGNETITLFGPVFTS